MKAGFVSLHVRDIVICAHQSALLTSFLFVLIHGCGIYCLYRDALKEGIDEWKIMRRTEYINKDSKR